MNQQHNPDNEELFDQASEWLVKLRSPSVTAAEKMAFSSWLNESKAHEQAYDEVKDLWDNLEAVNYIPELEAEVDELLNETKSRSMHWYGIAAAMLLAFMVSMFVTFSSDKSVFEAQYVSVVGEQKQYTLPDGSVVHLNTDTVVSVTYSDSTRLLVLEQGEAYFDVAKNPNRPFVVDVGIGSVEAVGTAFNIVRGDADVMVTVTEGIVKVAEKETRLRPIPTSQHVHADHSVALDYYGINKRPDLTTEQAMAWQQQLLIADSLPLGEILEQLDRYSNEQYRLDSSELYDIRVSGTYNTAEPEAMVDALSLSLNLALRTDVNGTKVLYRQ